MASVTRSNRRAEGVHHAHHAHHAHHHIAAHGHNQQPPTRAAKSPVELYAPNEGSGQGRPKRTLEPADRDTEALQSKKSRIAVEILARQQQQQQQQQSVIQGVRTNVQPPPIPRPPTNVPAPAFSLSDTAVNKTAPRRIISLPHKPRPIDSSALSTPAAASPPLSSNCGGSQYADEEEASPAKHQAKFANDTQLERDRLQPKPAAVREQGRKLRSQEATRFKSDLSAYFPDYDEVIGNDPKEQHLLNLDTPIVVFDSNACCPTPEMQRGGARVQHQTQPALNTSTSIRRYGDSLFTDVFDSQRIDFRFLETQQNRNELDDPLPDSLFKPSHKRAERLERSIRNSEKGRAQHEKDQIIRLLEGLQGHDWLRIMGVSGVTETRKRSFEPARMHFIKGCQGILEKFRTWSLEEKRRKLEKEKAMQAEQQAALEQEKRHERRRRPRSEIGDSEDEDTADEFCCQPVTNEPDPDQVDVIEESEEVVVSLSDTSDASPAKQLRQEALARSQVAATSSRKPRASSRNTALKSVDLPREFASFFRKKYERDSALNRTRRTGRKILAWGQPLPDMDHADFVLPGEYRDAELLKSRARKKRRDKRHSRP
ncbi:hypothetical protein E4U41_002391 [Claviceps citrina]|nr:hypothetical protein E4U41_002391 [Claviceps citrina]